jgi:hypothetical protein
MAGMGGPGGTTKKATDPLPNVNGAVLPGTQFGAPAPVATRSPKVGFALPGLHSGAPAPPAPAAPQIPLAGPTGGAPIQVPATPLPAEVTKIEAKGTVDPGLSEYSKRYEDILKAQQEGRSREAAVFNEGLDSNAERQVAAAREAAARDGRPFNEEAFRAELTRGSNKASAEFALGTQRDSVAAAQGGLGIMTAPGETERANKQLGLGAEGMMLNYALGRGGLANEANRTAVEAQNAASMRALDAYRMMLQSITAMV